MVTEDEADRQDDPDDHPTDPFDLCPDSKYQTHTFSLIGPDGITRCAFCGRTFTECLVVK